MTSVELQGILSIGESLEEVISRVCLFGVNMPLGGILVFLCRRLHPYLCMPDFASDAGLLQEYMYLCMEVAYGPDGAEIDSHGNLIAVGRCGLKVDMSLHQVNARCFHTCVYSHISFSCLDQMSLSLSGD